MRLTNKSVATSVQREKKWNWQRDAHVHGFLMYRLFFFWFFGYAAIHLLGSKLGDQQGYDIDADQRVRLGDLR